MARRHKSDPGASSDNGAESVGPDVEVCPETQSNVSGLTFELLEKMDPKYRELLSPGGRLAYAASVIAPELEAANDQTDIKRCDAQVKLLRYLDEAQSRGQEIGEHERLRTVVQQLVDQMQQDSGAQRLSNAPALPRKNGASAN